MSSREADAGQPARAGGPVWIAPLSLALLLLIWWVIAAVSGDPRVLPGPLDVGPMIAREAASGALVEHVAVTLRRVALSFAIAMAVGVALGVAMGRSRRLDAWLDPWLIVFLNLPALVTIVLAYLWIGLNETAAVAAVALNKIPTVIVTMREGARSLDRRLDDMARVFRMGRMDRLRHVAAPQLAPYLAASARSGLSLIWKIVLVVEFLGRSNGVGFMIHLHFQQFDVGMVLAYALSFIVVMLAIEKLGLQPLERRARRWRE